MYTTIDEIITASKNSDEPFFFAISDLRKWKTRIGSIVYGDRFFITSEKSKSQWATRRYTVRYCTDKGLIRNASDFQEYSSWAQANAAAIRFARNNQEAA